MLIDKTDEKILNVLLNEGRLSYREVAKNVGVSVVTVMNRVKALEEGKVIKYVGTFLDYEALGFEITVLVNLRIAKGKFQDLEKKIANHPSVSALYDTTGHFDSLIIARFRNRRALDAFLKKIQAYDFVERTETTFVLNVIKEKPIVV